MIREIEEKDLKGLLMLYTQLHEKKVPDIDEHIRTVWDKILLNEDYHIIVCEEDVLVFYLWWKKFIEYMNPLKNTIPIFEYDRLAKAKWTEIRKEYNKKKKEFK